MWKQICTFAAIFIRSWLVSWTKYCFHQLVRFDKWFGIIIDRRTTSKSGT